RLRQFWQKLWKPRSESGRRRFSRQLVSLVQTFSRTINPSGEQKGLFYENENFTHKNFDLSLVLLSRDSRETSDCARASFCVVCACAASASGLSRRLLNEQQHCPR